MAEREFLEKELVRIRKRDSIICGILVGAAATMLLSASIICGTMIAKAQDSILRVSVDVYDPEKADMVNLYYSCTKSDEGEITVVDGEEVCTMETYGKPYYFYLSDNFVILDHTGSLSEQVADGFIRSDEIFVVKDSDGLYLLVKDDAGRYYKVQ